VTQDIRAINDRVREESLFVEALLAELGKVIVGQRYLLERLLVGLFADGHLLLEGVPGLAKTLAVRTLAATVDARFTRIQFTPDLLPADLIGTLVFNPRTGEFAPRKGPIFTNLLLADEINRAPAKVQSALLEAMQERQVTIGEETYSLESPFLVLATQNPIEQEGTYPLPEAQLDRFLLKLKVTYPTREEERAILDRMSSGQVPAVSRIVTPERVRAVRALIRDVYMDEKIRTYILDLTTASREPERFGLERLKPLIAFGASPRATLALAASARALAFLNRRGYVTPEDVKTIAPDVLRHRLLLTYEAEAEHLTADDLVRQILDHVEVP
jgi:MoxR-like ATPase